MIKNYTMKLGFLSMIQEGMKGFPQGMPEAAQPVLETMGYSMEEFIPEPVREGQQEIMAQEESENGEPTEMPDGQPIASMETMYSDDANAQQMPANPPMPMAEYGMTLGGYGMPMYPDGGITPYEQAKTRQGNVTPTGTSNKFSARQQSLNDYLSQWEDRIPGVRSMSEGQAQKAIYDWSLANNPDGAKSAVATSVFVPSPLTVVSMVGEVPATPAAKSVTLTSGLVDVKLTISPSTPFAAPVVKPLHAPEYVP